MFRDQPDVGEADFSLIALSRDVKRDFRAVPLGSVFNKIKGGLYNTPHDFFAGNQFCYLLFGIMEVFVTIGKLGTGFVGAAFNFSCPPATNIIDGIEDFFRGLVYRKGSGEILMKNIYYLASVGIGLSGRLI
jgi:hypothetical protein